MLRKCAALLIFCTVAATGVWAQGQTAPPGVTGNDWEEINFEYNSSVLVDGFPALLRLAELLKQNPGYKVSVEGHTDIIGGAQNNQRLGLARANAVRDFLVKYGANANQITTSSQGDANPKYPGQKRAYSRTDEARWMNRRVSLTVTDAQGRTVSAGSAGAAIQALEAQQQQNAQCCSEVLKRLDKLDDIAKMLKDLADQNADLRKQLADLKASQDALKQSQQALQNQVNGQPKPPTTDEVATAVSKELESHKQPHFQLLGLNVGADDTGNTTFSGKGRYFQPLGTRFGVEAQAEYLYFKNQREGQFDAGLVDRLTQHLQAGLFASFKHVSLVGYQSGGTLGQGAFTLDYIFGRGKIGLFGTKGFMDDALINHTNATDPITGAALSHLFLDSYLSIVDQAGASGSVGLWGNNYLEGNLGYLHGIANGNRFGGTLRFVFPLNSKISFTAEGGMNETLLGPSNSGRAVFGLEFGNMLRPKQFLGASNPVPVDPPRVRYEVLTRRMRVGNDPPVADAGPNQFNVPAGTITLDGSKSYDPDGDPITFQWVQESGPAVSLSSPTGQTTAFTAAAGVFYSFRLLVKDNLGGQSIARVSVSTQKATPINIVFFAANPNQISSGQSSTLTWNVTGATSVTISGIGTVAANGSAPVSPTQTTTYTLTASNGGTSQTATAVIAVNQVASKLQYCYATPTNIMAGESATLNWATTNATSVNIQPGIGAVANSGNVAVSPTQTTTYVVTATGANGSAPDSCDITVSVTAGQLPRVLQFSAAPATIDNGQSSTLQWSVENADTVTITTLGNFSLNGTQSVSPTATTTYTLTATNKAGTVTSTATVTVHNTAPPPGTGGTGPMIQIAGGPTISSIYHIVELDASATTSPSGNLPLTYEWTQASGAPSAIEHSTSAIAIIDLPLQLGEYTFNLRVTDSKGNSSTQLVTVELVGATAP